MSSSSFNECCLNAEWPTTPYQVNRPRQPSPCIIITHSGSRYTFIVPRRVEGWVDLGTAGRVYSPCPRMYIAVSVVINTTACCWMPFSTLSFVARSVAWSTASVKLSLFLCRWHSYDVLVLRSVVTSCNSTFIIYNVFSETDFLYLCWIYSSVCSWNTQRQEAGTWNIEPEESVQHL